MNTRMRWGLILAVILAADSVFAGKAQDKAEDALASLDRSVKPAYEVSLGLVSEAGVDGGGDASMVEVGADWQFAYFVNVLGGDIDLNLDTDWIFLNNSGPVDLPEHLSTVALNAGGTWRYVNSMVLEARLKPGLYWDMKEFGAGPFYVPFSVVGMKGFNPNVAGQLGAEVRPGFEREIVPVLGVACRLQNRLYLKAGIPESRLTYYATSWIVPYLGLDWQSMTYGLGDQDGISDREFTIEDWRFYGGLRVRVSEEMQLAGEVGKAFARDFEFDPAPAGGDGDVNGDDAVFFRVALLGPF